MSLTITTQPATNAQVYAGDPLIFKLTTSLTSAYASCQPALIFGSDTIIGQEIFSLDASSFEFNMQKYVRDIFKTRFQLPPDPAATTMGRLRNRIAQFNATLNEYSGSPMVVSDTISSNWFIIVDGGTSWEQFNTRLFLANLYAGAETKQFLNWQADKESIDLIHPHFLSFLQPYGQTVWDVEIKAYDKDNILLGTYTAFTNSFTDDFGIFTIPIGWVGSGLSAKGYADDVVRFSVKVKTSLADISETRMFLVDRLPRRNRRHFLWMNSLGGVTTYTFTGESSESLSSEILTAPLFRPGTYNSEEGQWRVSEQSNQETRKVNSGPLSANRAKRLKDILYSREVYELLSFDSPSGPVQKWIPIERTGSSINIVNSKDFLSSIGFEYRYRFTNEFMTL
jgi:hypothetical protein